MVWSIGEQAISEYPDCLFVPSLVLTSSGDVSILLLDARRKGTKGINNTRATTLKLAIALARES